MTTAAPPRPAVSSWLLTRPEDAHCVVYHLLTVLAYAVAFWLWLHPEYSGLDTVPEQVVFVLAAAPLLGWISGIDVGVNYHNQTHIRIFRSRALSRWFARFWTPVAAWPPLFWRHLHVTVHHSHLFEERDWTLPVRKGDGRMESSGSYQLKHWPWRTVRHFVAEIRKGLFDRRVAAKDLFWFALVYSIPFWIDWRMALWLWVLPHWCANCITLNRGMYVQHAGCEPYATDHSRQHSNDFLTPFFNRTMFHIGYHAEHHDFPGIHWADLPDLHRALAARAERAARAAAAPAAPGADARPARPSTPPAGLTG